MPTYPFSNNPVIIGNARGKPLLRFNPCGKIFASSRANPYSSDAGIDARKGIYKMFALRVMVGFSVYDEALKVTKPDVYTLDDLVRETRKWLADNNLEQAGSFIAQRGVYTYGREHALKGEVVEENSGQIVYLAFIDSLDEAIDLSEKLCDYLRVRFHQESVIGEVQRGGVTQFSALCTA